MVNIEYFAICTFNIVNNTLLAYNITMYTLNIRYYLL